MSLARAALVVALVGLSGGIGLRGVRALRTGSIVVRNGTRHGPGARRIAVLHLVIAASLLALAAVTLAVPTNAPAAAGVSSAP